MSFNSDILISSTFGDFTRSYLSDSEIATYYIHDEADENLNIASGNANTLFHDNSDEIFIRSIFTDLDPLISLDFREVYNPEEAILRIYSISDFNRWNSYVVGQVSMQSSYWDILWRDTNYYNINFDRNTIVHEIGHSLGLSHPNEDPTNSLWDTDDTVMSYNRSSDGWDAAFTDNDINALQSIWGLEIDYEQIEEEVIDETPLEIDINPLFDDFSQDSNTTGLIEVGSSLTGSLEEVGDRDWFSINLSAGQILQLQLNGILSHSRICPCSNCSREYLKIGLDKKIGFIDKQTNKQNPNDRSLLDPYLRLYDSNSNLLTFDDDSGNGLNSLLTYKAEYSGIYYASAASYRDRYSGNYLLETSVDDFSSDSSTLGSIDYGENKTGNIEIRGDRDWYSINTLEGDSFRIELIGDTLRDAYLRLYNSQGILVGFDDDSGEGRYDSLLDFTSTYDGKYFISAGSWRDIYKGTYSLNANLLNSNASDIRGTDGDDYFYGFQGDNIYSFGSGFDTIDYSRLNESITLVRGGTVNKQENGIDTFTDFYDKLIATKSKDDWIDGITGGGQTASLKVDLSKDSISLENLPGVGSVSFTAEDFEHIKGSDKNDILKGDSNVNEIIGNNGDDFIYGDLGGDILQGGLGADIFSYNSKNESKLKKNGYDRILDFQIGTDSIDYISSVSATNISNYGKVKKLNNRQINKLLFKSDNYDFNAITFGLEDTNRTFLIVNNSRIGFQSNRDLFVEISGYSGDIQNLEIV